MLIAILLPSLDLNEQELHCAGLGCPISRPILITYYHQVVIKTYSLLLFTLSIFFLSSVLVHIMSSSLSLFSFSFFTSFAFLLCCFSFIFLFVNKWSRQIVQVQELYWVFWANHLHTWVHIPNDGSRVWVQLGKVLGIQDRPACGLASVMCCQAIFN